MTMTAEKTKFTYMMLSRLKSDCDYFLGYGGKGSSLWGITVEEHIKEMKVLWNKLTIKPEWLTLKELQDYEINMSSD